MRQDLHPARPRRSPSAHHIIEEFVERNAIPGASIAIITAGRLDVRRCLRPSRPRHPRPGDAGDVLPVVLAHQVVTATAVRMPRRRGPSRARRPGRGPRARACGDSSPGPLCASSSTTPRASRTQSRSAGSEPTPRRDSSADDLLDASWPSTAAPQHPIGGPVRYSNLGYLVLGAVIEAAAGEPFPGYVRRAILRPLGMDRTDFVHTHPDSPPPAT